MSDNITYIEKEDNYLVCDIKRQLKYKLTNKQFVIDKSGVKTIEIVGANFIADRPSIFGTVNEDYVNKEIDWYLSESLNVNDIKDTPEIWKKVSDDNGLINSNYGWCIYSDENNNQYDHCLDELISNKDSRRAIMIYNRPNMWYDYNKGGRSDFMCTNAVQYLIRDNRLCVVVQMRSNDAVYGYKNDRAWQVYVQKMLLHDLTLTKYKMLELGPIYWNAGSLHVYEKHFGLMEG